MLIIVAGVLVMMGYMGIGTSQQGKRITEKNAGYAEYVHAKNAAQTAIQIAMNNINADPDWDDNNATETSPWQPTIEDASISLFIESLTSGTKGLLEKDTIRIVSRANYFDESAEVISVYQKWALHYVPKFTSAITFATSNYNFLMDGSATVSGNDLSGQCGDKPGIETTNDSDSAMVANNGGASYIDGTPQVTVDSDLSYSPVDDLIARLETMPGVKHLSGEYKGDMGTETDPGVFFVDDPTNLTGGLNDGYGILVVRTDGELQYDGSLEIAGNFTFNGLVVFENAWNFDGEGTPTVHGNVLVGNTSNTSPLDANLTGNIHIQYDCAGETYAQMAAANLLKQNRYKRMTTFE